MVAKTVVTLIPNKPYNGEPMTPWPLSSKMAWAKISTANLQKKA
jgi:hypothetical protein